MGDVKIMLKGVKTDDVKDSILITGFQGFGGVGYITTRYLVSKLKAKRIGYILTSNMPDVTFSDSGRIALPYEIFIAEHIKGNFTVIVNHAVPVIDRNKFAKNIISWALDSGVKEAVFIGGLDVNAKRDESKYRVLPNAHFKKEPPGKILENDLYIIGPLALLTIYSEIYGLPALVLLPYTEPARVDPAAAAVAVEVLNEMYGLNVDPSELYRDAEAIEKELARVSELQRAVEVESKRTHYM